MRATSVHTKVNMVCASGSLGGTAAVVQNGDITVERRIHPSRRDESFVTMAVRNTGSDDLSIQVQESVSDAVENVAPIESLDPESHSWQFDGDRIVHEHEIPANDDRSIIYEIQLSSGVPELELSQPSIVSVEVIEGEIEDDSSDSDATEDVLWRGGASPAVPAATPSENSAETVLSPSDDAAASNLVERLVAELESSDDEDLAALREQLRPERSERVRLEHFRSRVDDMAAYADILQSFLDEYGHPGEVVEGVCERLEENETELEVHGSELDNFEETMQEREHEIETTVQRFEAEIERLGHKFETLQDQVEEWHTTQRQIAMALSGEEVDGEPSD